MAKIVGKENVLSSETDLLLYGYDASLFRGKPDCIVLPGSTEEVSKVVKFAHETGIPVVARGSGTNLSGGTIPTQGGIVLHFSRMNRILEIDIENQRAVVEPGVFTLALKNHWPVTDMSINRILPAKRSPPSAEISERIPEDPTVSNME